MKKPTLKIMNDYCKSQKVEPITLQLAEDCELKITPSLSLVERLTFINRVADFCVSETGEELPEYFDLIFWTTVFQMMSNMPMPKVKDEDESLDLTTMHKWIDSLPQALFHSAMHANDCYLEDLYYACRAKVSTKVEFMTSLIGSMGNINTAAQTLVDKAQVMEYVNDELTGRVKATKQLTAVYGDKIVELSGVDD